MNQTCIAKSKIKQNGKYQYIIYNGVYIFFWQRNDIAMAITKFDQFDFLIDIVPRDELKPAKRQVNINPYWFSQIYF